MRRPSCSSTISNNRKTKTLIFDFGILFYDFNKCHECFTANCAFSRSSLSTNTTEKQLNLYELYFVHDDYVSYLFFSMTKKDLNT